MVIARQSLELARYGLPTLKCILRSRHFMNATIVDLRYKMKDVLRAIDRGESVTVLYRGKARARLTPIAVPGATPKTREQPLFGLWKDREDMSDPASYVRQLRLPRRAVAPDGIDNRKRLRNSK